MVRQMIIMEKVVSLEDVLTVGVLYMCFFLSFWLVKEGPCLVQPYVSSVGTYGELSFVFAGNTLVLCVKKIPPQVSPCWGHVLLQLG